jgi:phosphoglycolate phosphatase-like HAD superfamily hydrolase
MSQMEQGPMNAPDIHSASPVKRGGWGRFLFRIIRWGGICLFLFLAFLIAITVPNLRREVAPPEISGPEQVARNATKSPASPTSSTLTVSSPTSGTQPLLNLDDFPHLSPTMRKLAQGWVDECAETDRLIAAISDPALRAQALSLLKDRETRMLAFLNLPLEWESQSYREAFDHLIELLRSQNPYGEACDEIRRLYRGLLPKENLRESIEFLQEFPELADSLGKEVIRLGVMTGRMHFEMSVRNHLWNLAALDFFENERDLRASFYDQKPNDVWIRACWAEANTREEGVYCMRQARGAGVGWLTAYSYQRTLDSLMDDPTPSLFYHQSHKTLRMPSDLVMGFLAETIVRKEKKGRN